MPSRSFLAQYSDWIRAGKPDTIFLFATAVSILTVTSNHLPIQCVLGVLSPGAKRQKREDEHSTPPSADVKNAWSFISIPPHTFITWRFSTDTVYIPSQLTKMYRLYGL